MNQDAEIAVLQNQMKHVMAQLEEKEKDLQAFHEDYNITKKKINTAEAYGRGVIWATIAIAGFMSQWGGFVAFIKKHI